MNLLLLTAAEAATADVLLTDDRATHVRTVLRANPGDQLRVGILDGPIGTGMVRAVDDAAVELCCEFEGETENRSEDTLLLAVPRPVVLQRSLAQAAALGFGRIVLFRSWRVDKSHLAARVLEPATTRRHLIEGLSQARRTRVPEVHFFPLFKPFVEDDLDGLVPATNRFVAHPGAAQELATCTLEAAPLTLAIGPERGFLPYEVGALEERGFTAVQAGDHPLRVETALAYVTGQLELLRRRFQT